jgi:hypothetical protein
MHPWPPSATLALFSGRRSPSGGLLGIFAFMSAKEEELAAPGERRTEVLVSSHVCQAREVGTHGEGWRQLFGRVPGLRTARRRGPRIHDGRLRARPPLFAPQGDPQEGQQQSLALFGGKTNLNRPGFVGGSRL